MSHRYYMSNGDARFVFHADHATSPEHFRPVVVIDPEDAESVERLTGCLAVNGANPNDRNYWRETQAALREFATPTPPKPEEPQGVGAVVEDVDGRRWTLLPPHASYDRWACWGEPLSDRSYADIDVVRVLSEGVA